MPAPLKWKSKALLAKIETTSGTDAVPTAAANAILATDVTLVPMDGDDITRNLENPWLGGEPTLPINVRSTLTFNVELVGSGTLGTAPAWGPLMRMCAAAQTITAATKVEYTPITDNHESGTIYFQIDTTRHVMLGCKGTAMITVDAQGIPVARFTITGLFTVPTEQTKLTPDFTAFQAPQVATKTNTPTFTIGGINQFVLRKYELDLGNDVQPRMLIGSESIQIVDRVEKLTCQVEALPVTTYNPYTIAQNSTPQAIVIQHGTVAGRKFQIDVAKALQERLSGYEVQQNLLEWPLSFRPQPTAGNDQWKITLT